MYDRQLPPRVLVCRAKIPSSLLMAGGGFFVALTLSSGWGGNNLTFFVGGGLRPTGAVTLWRRRPIGTLTFMRVSVGFLCLVFSYPPVYKDASNENG